MTTDYARIYRERAEEYDALVSAEDHAGNLWPKIRAIRDTAGKAVLEVGVGTGRLTRVLARDAAAVYGCDIAPAMSIESLGTGTTASVPPTSAHADYYQWLQRDRGFTLWPVRTDYRFASVADAVRLTRAFFGEGMAANVSQRAVRDVPECTAVLWKVV